MAKYIYQYRNWPHFTWEEQEIQVILGKVRYLQGKLLGQLSLIGFSLKEETLISTLTLDVLKSSKLEGELLDYEQVRSSAARRLGIEYAGMIASSRNVEGAVEMMFDSMQNYNKILNEERLFGWHAALFPTGKSGIYKIDVACYRKNKLQVVSGPMGNEKIHYQAPSPKLIKQEMDLFLNWFNNDTKLDIVLKAAIAYFWFVTIQPFDDGNSRIAKAISDILLARSESSSQRFYSLSDQILVERWIYYDILQKVLNSNGDITEWLNWFLNCLYKAMESSEKSIQKVLHKAQFWERHKETLINSRQRLMLNKLLDGMEVKLKSSNWSKITKCSADTALRDIKDLIAKGILKLEESGGRSTNYELIY